MDQLIHDITCDVVDQGEVNFTDKEDVFSFSGEDNKVHLFRGEMTNDPTIFIWHSWL